MLGHNFILLTLYICGGGGCQKFAMRKFCLRPLIFVIIVDSMVLDLVNCLAIIHCTTIFALRNGKFSRLRKMAHPSIPPSLFIPAHIPAD